LSARLEKPSAAQCTTGVIPAKTRTWGISRLSGIGIARPWTTHRLSSLRKQGPNYQLTRAVKWVPAFAGMTPSMVPVIGETI